MPLRSVLHAELPFIVPIILVQISSRQVLSVHHAVTRMCCLLNIIIAHDQLYSLEHPRVSFLVCSTTQSAEGVTAVQITGACLPITGKQHSLLTSTGNGLLEHV